MLNVGDSAPDFALENDSGVRSSLDGLLRDGPLILYFYPGDFTPICTQEACMYRDAVAELAGAGVRVVGISPDAPQVHARFRASQRLQFPLLSDPDRAVAKAYRSIGWFGLPIPWGVRRISYLIAPDRRIVDAVAAEHRLSRHREFVRRAMDAYHAPA